MPNNQQRYILSGMKILINREWIKDQALIIEDKKIKALIPHEMISHHMPAIHKKFPANFYLAPGMIDLHIHGAHGHDVMDGSVEALNKISHALASEGVTGFLATTMTATNEKISDVLKIIPAAMRDCTGAEVLGVHLEGPFIAKLKAGAQLADATLDPDIKLVNHWQSISEKAIKLITLAPELKHAEEFIHQIRKLNIVASIGHTHATYAETQAAIAAGCTHATHLFNAMSGLQQRAPGAVGALLLSEKITAELIVDGIHLHPAIVEIALRLKGVERLVLVSDAMRAKCMNDGVYDLGGQEVVVANGKAVLKDGTLAGSTLKLSQAVKNMAAETHCNLIDAIEMATFNPARVLKLDDRKGSIAVGKDADLFVMSHELDVVYTMRGGKEVFVTTN